MRGELFLTALVVLSFFALVFGVIYIRSRENMALIERGINPRTGNPKPKHFINLKWGLLLCGAGTGLLLAYFLDRAPGDNPAIYFSLIAIGGGAGLVLSYQMEKKYWLERERGIAKEEAEQ